MYAIEAICPSTNGGVLPSAPSRARSSACQSAASRFVGKHREAGQNDMVEIAFDHSTTVRLGEP